MQFYASRLNRLQLYLIPVKSCIEALKSYGILYYPGLTARNRQLIDVDIVNVQHILPLSLK